MTDATTSTEYAVARAVGDRTTNLPLGPEKPVPGETAGRLVQNPPVGGRHEAGALPDA
jgi:hypothetical protein